MEIKVQETGTNKPGGEDLSYILKIDTGEYRIAPTSWIPLTMFKRVM